MNKNPKVLFILQLPPPVHGAAMINKIINESKLINNNFKCYYVNLTTAKNLNDIRKPSLRKYFLAIGIYFKVLKNIILHKFQLVYITLSPYGIAFYRDAILVLVLKFFGIRLVFHLHGKGINDTIKKSNLKAWFYGQVFKNVNIIHLSKLLYFDIEKVCDTNRVWYLPNGIRLNDNFEIQNKPKSNKILYLSNMQESKGSFKLLQAAKILKNKNIDFHIDFVGKWHNDNNFKKRWLAYYNKNKMETYVTYHGPKYGKEKQQFFIEANIFVLPTSNDCFPLSILEAMSYANVVISTNQGAIPEIIEDNFNGYVLNENTPEDLSKKIIEVLKNNKLNQRIALRGFNKAQKLYSDKQFEINFCTILKRIIKT